MKIFILSLFFTSLLLISCDKNEENSRFLKTINSPIEPCDYITKQLIIGHFGMSNSILELKAERNSESNTIFRCGYSWKKSLSNEIESTQSELLNSEKANNYIQIGNFKTYNDHSSALRDFKNSHRIILNEDVKPFAKETMGSKYTLVSGAGDQAFFDHVNSSLNVRFGMVSFSVYIGTEFDTATNILIAKKIAKEVWSNI